MKPAPLWFIQRFADRYDITSPTVLAHLAVLWHVQREGQKRMYTVESALGEEYSDSLTTYGQKMLQRRRAAAKRAKAARRVNQRATAVVRGKRQKRNKRHA